MFSGEIIQRLFGSACYRHDRKRWNAAFVLLKDKSGEGRDHTRCRW
jgi:hypothetical protein